MLSVSLTICSVPHLLHIRTPVPNHHWSLSVQWMLNISWWYIHVVLFFNLTHSYHFHWCRLYFSGEGFLRWVFFLMCCLTCALIIQSNHQPFCLRAKQTFLWMVSFALAAVFVQLKGITHNLCLLAVLPALWVVHGCVIYVEHHEHSIRKRQSVERRDYLK